MSEFDTEALGDLLPMYYQRLFPANLMYKWLSYGDDSYFARREFSFTLAGDIYIRFQSFNNLTEFENELKKKRPEKIDIGAVYTQKPKNRDSSGSFQPESKEFVLDIDLTDYDDVRTCCEGAKVCEKCWKFIAVAVDILDAALREDFGFSKLLWVFSGRRGVHCWVCDEVARELDTSGRAAVIEYLQVVRGGESKAKKIQLADKIHPSIRRALKVLDPAFESICKEDQSVFDNVKHLEMLPTDIRDKVQVQLRGDERWDNILHLINEKNEKRDKNKKAASLTLQEIQLQLCYPRLDVNVSKGLNHLLKAPFCIHPKTGQVCVPFEPKRVHEFKIAEVPTITKLIDEIGSFDKEHENQTNIKAWKKTSLASYIKLFEKFVKPQREEMVKTMEY
ncbi:unnamed protein product [Allacma fusca]|uniref:DNA primase n=1 Tax=Allacma fusca TaxID=39272 RepID=A0A8J2LTM3_9HEXA|nr:unnamed protein product [Allacma fusca]